MAVLDATNVNRSPAIVGTNMNASEAYLCQNDGRTIFYFRGAGTNAVITVAVPFTVDGMTVPARTFTVNANTVYFVGGFEPSVYNNSAGRISFTSSIANVIIGVLRV